MIRETIKLNHTMKLLIPDRDRYGNQIDTQSVINELSSLIGKSIGGLQISRKDCIWKDHYGKLMFENVAMLEASFNTESIADLAEIFINYTLSLSKDLNQAAIALKIDDTFISVTNSNSTENSKKLIIRRIRRKNNQIKKRHLNKRRKYKGS